MTKCPSCGTGHEGEPKFCDNCGHQFPSAPSTPVLKKCPDCAEDVRAEARKCRFCGFEFLPEEAQPDEEQQEPVEESPERPEMKTHWKGLIALALVSLRAAAINSWPSHVRFTGMATGPLESREVTSATFMSPASPSNQMWYPT